MKNKFILDFGRNNSTILNTENDIVETLSHSDVLDLPNKLPKGSLLICEYAHLGCPRKRKSKAQPYTSEQLLKFYKNLEDNNIELRLFPHQSTPRAQNLSRLEKSDQNDPKSINILLNTHPEISLMKPPQDFNISNKTQEFWDIKDDLNYLLNISREENYESDNGISRFIEENIDEIHDKVSDKTKDIFGISKYKSGKINHNKLRYPVLYSIIGSLMDYDGNLRIRNRTNRLPSWKNVKRRIYNMSGFHMRGGVARSNIYYHGLRHWVATNMASELNVDRKSILRKRRGGYTNQETGEYVEPFTQEENILFRKYRLQYVESLKEFFMICKNILERKYNLK